MECEPTENSRTGTTGTFLRGICLGNTHVVPEAVIDKMDASWALKNVWEMQVFVEISRF